MAVLTPARTEIWCRKDHIEGVIDGSITTVIRPGRRLLHENHPKALGVGEIVQVRIVDQVGADWAGVYGTLLDNPHRVAEIADVRAINFSDLTPDDFAGLLRDITNPNELRIHLSGIYNLAGSEIAAREFTVTRTAFRYLDPNPSSPTL